MLVFDERYPLVKEDFPEFFHQVVFVAIDHLARKGVKQLDEYTIDDYLSHFPTQYAVFEKNRGMDYLHAASELSLSENYEYYYNELKKCSLLRDLKAKGFDTTQFYDPTKIHVDETEAIQQRFRDSSLQDIIETYQYELAELGRKYNADGDIVECHIASGMESLKEELKESPDYGAPMNSAKLATICHGRRRKKFYLRTAPSGLSKTRAAMADACRIAVPAYYDPDTKSWKKTNQNERVLFITTELEMNEIQTMLWAYVACVPEDHIIDNKYVNDEEQRVDEAIKIIEHSNFWAVYIPSFTADDIESIIKRYKQMYDVGYVFVDYIFSSSKLFNEMSQKARGFRLREDQSLMVFAEKLKTLANRYDIHIDSSTQANDDWKQQKNPDQSVIRGAKAIADKVDIGYVMLEPTEKDQIAIQSIMAEQGKSFCQAPNMVYHIYKVRRGKISHVKLFIYFDFATLRTTDLFVTDRDYHLVHVDSTNIETVLDDTEINREEVNNIEVKDGSFIW